MSTNFECNMGGVRIEIDYFITPLEIIKKI